MARKNERQVVTCRGGLAGGKRGANVSTVVTIAAHVFLPGKSRMMRENDEQGMKYSRAPFPRFIGKLCAPRHLEKHSALYIEVQGDILHQAHVCGSWLRLGVYRTHFGPKEQIQVSSPQMIERFSWHLDVKPEVQRTPEDLHFANDSWLNIDYRKVSLKIRYHNSCD